jgi:hypothetical protein
MTRLGQLESYEWLREHAMLRGDKDTFAYMSIDLGDHAEARTKVYIAHRDATAFDIEHAMSGVDENEPGDAIECCVALADTCGPFTQRPLLTCFAFVAGKREPITGSTSRRLKPACTSERFTAWPPGRSTPAPACRPTLRFAGSRVAGG